MRFPKKLAIAVASVLFAGNALADTVELATDGYNRLVFPEPYSKIVFTPESPLHGAPLPLAEKRSVLVRLKPDAKNNAYAFVQLVSGETFPLTLVPKGDLEPVTWRYKQAADSLPQDKKLMGRPEDKWLVETMFAPLDNKIPEGFDQIPAQGASQLGPIIASVVARFRAPGYLLTEFRLTSDILTPIKERDFYRKGVAAVMLETDVVSPEHQPHLLVLEHTDDE